MIKFRKTILSSAVALSLLVSSGSVVITNAQETEKVEEQSNIGTNSILNPKQLIGLGYKVLKYGANTWLFHPEAYTYEGQTQLEVSSGKIGYNKKDDSGYGASSKHDVVVSSTSEQIETFAETDFINMFTAKIAVIITDPQNNDVVSKTLTHEQYVFYNPTRTGTYSIRYVDENKLNWNLYVTLSSYQIDISSKNAVNVLGSDGKLRRALYKDGKVYIYPSETHKSSFLKESLSLNNTFNNKTVSLKELQTQFYDEELKRNVRDLKDYRIGDSIHFKDEVASIEYDPNSNHTLIGFKDQDNDIVNWVFKDNLLDRFKVGDVIELKLNVVEETEEFENIDLIKPFKTVVRLLRVSTII
ncbi:hypothetical protein [Paenibacillus timonensis]|uniref:hypothetical protein n=1 Tax=Paenibacillus timonensis TaxID=225915 RepID=UPI003F99FB89